MVDLSKLTEGERTALYNIYAAGGSLLTSRIPEKNYKDVHGDIDPGIRVYQKLEKMGLIYITEEDLIDEDDPDLGTWTPTAEFTEEGNKVAEQMFRRS